MSKLIATIVGETGVLDASEHRLARRQIGAIRTATHGTVALVTSRRAVCDCGWRGHRRWTRADGPRRSTAFGPHRVHWPARSFGNDHEPDPSGAVLSGPPMARGITSGGAKGNRTPDLLDANETTWALAAPSCVGSTPKPQVKRLVLTVTKSCRKFYCGLAAD
jgi:hypothetical protein